MPQERSNPKVLFPAFRDSHSSNPDGIPGVKGDRIGSADTPEELRFPLRDQQVGSGRISSPRSPSNPALPLFCPLVSSLRGRFSVITMCRDVETSQVFAAKITPYKAEQRQLVLREYQLLKRLHHPHLVQLHTAYISSSHLVLVEELCPGKELLYSLASR